MTSKSAVSTTNTLSKLGAHLRWQVEKSGVDPEKVDVFIVVRTKDEAALIKARFLEDFDPAAMTHNKNAPHLFCVHGVKIHFGITEPV